MTVEGNGHKMMSTKLQGERAVSATAFACGQSKEIGVHALAESLNELAAAGAGAVEARVHIMIPDGYGRPRLAAVQKLIEKVCGARGVTLIFLEQYKTPAAALPLVSVTCTGTAEYTDRVIRPGQDIVLTKWAGLGGMVRILQEKEDELEERFAPAFIKQIKEYAGEIFAGEELPAARQMGVSVFCQVTEGGIFAALWNLAREAETGLSVDMKKIPVRQETIEVCENYRLNPYQLMSAGSFLMVADNGRELARELTGHGMKAAVIGRMTDNNDKVIQNGEEIRFIDRPAPDELNKILGHTKRGE